MFIMVMYQLMAMKEMTEVTNMMAKASDGDYHDFDGHNDGHEMSYDDDDDDDDGGGGGDDYDLQMMVICFR